MKNVKPKTQIERRVLAWCNKQRKNYGFKPRKTISGGHCLNSDSCVITRTAKLNWTERYIAEAVNGDIIKLPKYIQRFINFFDRGDYPHLEE